MRRFVLDTNICLAYIRGNSLYKQVEADHQLTQPDAIVLISVVTKGELLSLGKQKKWGNRKLEDLQKLLRKLIIIDINDSDDAITDAYAEIDAFSQGNLAGKPLGTSARNMGKNDLWIAATAFVAKARLITTDQDFNHLDPLFIPVSTYLP